MRNHRAIIRCGDHCEIRMTSISPVSNGELVVAPEKVSICGTDIQILRGQRDDPAPIVGHEGLSTVIAAGRGVNDFFGRACHYKPHPSVRCWIPSWAQRKRAPAGTGQDSSDRGGCGASFPCVGSDSSCTWDTDRAARCCDLRS